MIEADDAAVRGGDGGGHSGHAVKEGGLSEDAACLIGGQQLFLALIRQDPGADGSFFETVEIAGLLALHMNDLALPICHGLSGGEKRLKQF